MKFNCRFPFFLNFITLSLSTRPTSLKVCSMLYQCPICSITPAQFRAYRGAIRNTFLSLKKKKKGCFLKEQY